ncbi:hypothetical protein [Cryobacterium sp. CG_9.6]|uniref:hypothetical protein n=1 Tax=Cryobacterium sp. CG_9.6 TaxID=2760710 RepID=UPI0024734905|nr:hypothetical protein [Cryobacterium sp. CG_9.6]MDH6236277.1 hypothetical protein [Cryobacterium sp. CG_9.6]
MGNLNPRRQSVDPSDVTPVVSDAALATNIVEGALVPVLVLDTSVRPDLTELIRIHQHIDAGDIVFAWAANGDNVQLLIDFLRPVEASAVIPLSIERQAILVDMMLQAKAVYLQAGKPGERFRDHFSDPRVLVELPHTGMEKLWDNKFLRQMEKVFRSRGLRRADASQAASTALVDLRKLTTIRIQS